MNARVGGVRAHGAPPFRVAVVHGGPGAPGSASGLARDLGDELGTLEPLQCARSLDGQVEELASQLRTRGDPPLVVVGHSWGAMLGYLLAARHPTLLRRLVMVASAVFTAEASEQTHQRRLAGISAAEGEEMQSLRERLHDPWAARRYDDLLTKTDSVAPISTKNSHIFESDINRAVWADAKRLRDSGRLLDEGRSITCPILVIHGAQDPHPLQGVVEPLRRTVRDLEVVVLDRCGHVPWNEFYARKKFLQLVVETCL